MAKIVRTKKRWIWLIKGPMALLLTFGLALGLFQLFVAGVDFFPTDIELPLGDLDGVSIGGDNLILVGTAYNRIQVYTPTGEFIRAIDVHGKLFKFYVNPRGLVRASTGSAVQSYSMDGELLRETRDTSAHDREFSDIPKSAFIDEEGNTYSIARHSWLFPRILRTTSDGESSIVVSQPLYLWLIQFPFPALFYVWLGMGTLVICYLSTELRKRRQKKKTPVTVTPDNST